MINRRSGDAMSGQSKESVSIRPRSCEPILSTNYGRDDFMYEARPAPPHEGSSTGAPKTRIQEGPPSHSCFPQHCYQFLHSNLTEWSPHFFLSPRWPTHTTPPTWTTPHRMRFTSQSLGTDRSSLCMMHAFDKPRRLGGERGVFFF